MALVAGASQYMSQAAYSNATGAAAQQPSLLGSGGGTASLLSVGKRLAPEGIGISANARQLNEQFLQQSSGTFNQLFSAAGGGSSTEDALKKQILALRSSVPTSRETPEVREAKQEALEEAEEAASTSRGNLLDRTV